MQDNFSLNFAIAHVEIESGQEFSDRPQFLQSLPDDLPTGTMVVLAVLVAAAASQCAVEISLAPVMFYLLMKSALMAHVTDCFSVSLIDQRDRCRVTVTTDNTAIAG